LSGDKELGRRGRKKWRRICLQVAKEGFPLDREETDGTHSKMAF